MSVLPASSQEDDLQNIIAELELRNRELLKQNQELESFAYVAGHDLQEPLRKIQIFSNRILEMEKENFSVVTKDHFNRILSATSRMQKLIDVLINYSRTGTDEKIFAKQDLNLLLAEVEQNLQDAIQEKNATLHVADLPSLSVIPHQFVQLLENLISNSLKYSKEGVPPLIDLDAELVEIPNLNNAPEKYWCLKLSDNGIGFEEKYTEKIFELFQRLHGKHEYEGTGIGLAICRKIVQNHNGFIRAESTPNEGAIFKIYIPENA